MKFFVESLLVSAASAAIGAATLEATVANESGCGFNGRLDIYMGRNCNINTLTGRICDYKYLQYMTGLQQGKTYSYQLTSDVDPDNDQLIFTYRSNDHACFSGLKVTVNLGSSTRVIDLMELEGGGDNYMVFDYDTRMKPCGSSYPRGSSCSFDQTFDFYSMKVKPHYSLLRGHVVKRQAEPVLAPRLGSTRASTQLQVRTGNDVGDGSDAPISIYYGTKCNANICQYNKVAELIAKDRGTEYSLWMPDFDWAADQLIIDYRDGDDLFVQGLTFTPCINNNCKAFDLTKFGTSTSYGLAFDYEEPEEPCGSFSYGTYICQYDAVFDFKKMVKYMDKSVFVGQ